MKDQVRDLSDAITAAKKKSLAATGRAACDPRADELGRVLASINLILGALQFIVLDAEKHAEFYDYCVAHPNSAQGGQDRG